MTGVFDPLLTFAVTDYAGITRGRSIPAANYQPHSGRTLGWVGGSANALSRLQSRGWTLFC